MRKKEKTNRKPREKHYYVWTDEQGRKQKTLLAEPAVRPKKTTVAKIRRAVRKALSR